jgi:hypothetical protein
MYYICRNKQTKREIMKAIKNYKMVSTLEVNPILENVSISDVKKKYEEIVGVYICERFDRCFTTENIDSFTLPLSPYGSIHVYSV